MTSPTINPVLDWHPPSPHRKEANQPYRLFVQLGREAPADIDLKIVPKSRRWRRRVWLDQGQQGACTGFGLSHCLGAGYQFWPVQDQDAFNFYYLARLHDEWAGENYDGSSVQGACEGAKSVGVIHKYVWIETPEEFKAAVARYGAVDVGSAWKSGMWQADSDGFVHAVGTNEGGHSYCVGGVNLEHNYAVIDNSWGKRWAVDGSAKIDLDELFGLIFQGGGECALIRKKLYVPGALSHLQDAQ